MLMNRADYKAIKHMDRESMTAYLQRVYRRGFEAGVKSVAAHSASDSSSDAVPPKEDVEE